MKDLVISNEERRILTESNLSEEGVPIFFPHSISEDEFAGYRTLWDKILDASEVDEEVVSRIRRLLPKQALDIREVTQLQSYNCFTAASYALGVDGFDLAMEFSSPETGMLSLPMGGLSFIHRQELGQSGFREVRRIKEEGSKGLVLFQSSIGREYDHAAVYLGSAEGQDFFFHKPLPCLPDIKPLETILKACSYAGGRRPRAAVTYSCWQMDLPEDAVLVEGIVPLVYNAQTEGDRGIELQKRRDPRALVIGDHDLTSIILYQDDKAVAIVSKCLWNGVGVNLSIYARSSDGRYGEWHEDYEHGDWRIGVEVPRSRLEDLDRHNPDSIPLLQVLGRRKSEVEEVLDGQKKFAYHAESSGANFFEGPRKLLTSRE